MNEKRTALYRHFSEYGDLLYVGISLEPVRRLAQHLERSDWVSKIGRISISWFGNRKEAEDAEKAAIVSERPKHNRMHSPGPAAPTGEPDLTNRVLLWNPNYKGLKDDGRRGQVRLVEHPEKFSRDYEMSWGACNVDVKHATYEARRMWLACQLLTMMVGDRVPADEIHRACWPLKEYRDCLPADVRGPNGEINDTGGEAFR